KIRDSDLWRWSCVANDGQAAAPRADISLQPNSQSSVRSNQDIKSPLELEGPRSAFLFGVKPIAADQPLENGRPLATYEIGLDVNTDQEAPFEVAIQFKPFGQMLGP